MFLSYHREDSQLALLTRDLYFVSGRASLAKSACNTISFKRERGSIEVSRTELRECSWGIAGDQRIIGRFLQKLRCLQGEEKMESSETVHF